MQNLLKFALLILISLTTLNANIIDTLDPNYFEVRTGYPNSTSWKKINEEVTFINNQYLRIGDKIYSYSSVSQNIFNLALKKDTGYYARSADIGDLYYYKESYPKRTLYCNDRKCAASPYSDYTNPTEFSYFDVYSSVFYLKTCQPDENFNTETKQCQKCPEGYSWNPAANKCYKDCSDAKKNMYGWDDGSCTDCSHAKTTGDVYRCFCGGLGLGVPSGGVADPGFPNGGKCGRKGACLDGYQFEYTDPECKEDKDPKPDDNSTKPQDPDTPDNPKDPKNPKPNPDNPNPNPDGPKPDPDDSNNEFCKKNPNDPKCKDDYCKKNPKDPKCKKDTNSTKPGGPGGGGGGDDDGKDKDAKFDPKDFDYNDIEKEVNGFKDTILKHYNDMHSNFDDFKRGYNQLINNIQGKGFSAIKGQSSSSSCPKAFKIDMGYNVSKTVYIDICKEFSKLKSTFYYIFYLFFFCFFLFLTIKLTIPLMVNQFKYI